MKNIEIKSKLLIRSQSSDLMQGVVEVLDENIHLNFIDHMLS